MSRARRRISWAARRLKVSIRMRPGSTPFMTRCATRCASVLVLPVPAPAMINSGPQSTPFSAAFSPTLPMKVTLWSAPRSSPKVAALRWAVFNAAMYVGVVMPDGLYEVAVCQAMDQCTSRDRVTRTPIVDQARSGKVQERIAVECGGGGPHRITMSGMTRTVRGAGLQASLPQRLRDAAQHLGARLQGMRRQQRTKIGLMFTGPEVALEHHRIHQHQLLGSGRKQHRETGVAEPPRGGTAFHAKDIQQRLLDTVLGDEGCAQRARQGACQGRLARGRQAGDHKHATLRHRIS